MARHEGREVATPDAMGEQLDAPKYRELWREAASRVFFASYREYDQHVKFANSAGVVRRQLMSVGQLIPVYVQRCFAQQYYQRKVLTAEELLNPLKQHRVTAQMAARWCAKGQQQKFAAWQKCSPAVVLSKIVLCMSARLSNAFLRESGRRRLIPG